MATDGYVTDKDCEAVSTRIFAKLDSIERRLFRDNGTLSIQTRLDRHEQVLKVLLWVTSVIMATALSAGVLGVVAVFRWVMAGGAG